MGWEASCLSEVAEGRPGSAGLELGFEAEREQHSLVVPVVRCKQTTELLEIRRSISD